MKNDLVKKGYDTIAERYLGGRSIFDNTKYLDMFSKLVEKGKTVLDVGCGAGIPIDDYLIEQGFAVNGIDISEKQIQLAKKYVPEAFYEVKDMLDIKEGEYCVDGIVSLYAIFHIPRELHGDILKKFSSFLPKGGALLITMASTEWEGEEEFFGVTMYQSHYGVEKNTELVENAGFEIIVNEIDTSGDEKHQVIIGEKS